jgi:hypothetical protein
MHSHAVYMNAQASSIALLETVIPASESILSCKDSLDELPCLRTITIKIAGQSSRTAIIADEMVFLASVANKVRELSSDIYVAVKLG